MKTLKRLKTVIAVIIVSVMAATIMPSTASAEGEGPIESELTVEVNLGPVDPDFDPCPGAASLTVPNLSTMNAELLSQELGNEDPTISEVLDYYFESVDGLPGSTIITPDLVISYETVRNLVDANGPVIIEGVQQTETVYSRADTNQDGVIDIQQGADGVPIGLTLSRRVFATSEFTVRFEADDCEPSDQLGVLLSYRYPLNRSTVEDTWVEAEFEEDYFDDVSGLPSSADNLGLAYLLLRINALNGQISLPVMITREPTYLPDPDDPDAYYGYGDFTPIAFGDEASADMTALVEVYGNSSSGLYQVKFGYALEVFDNFLSVGNLSGCWLYGCGPVF